MLPYRQGNPSGYCGQRISDCEEEKLKSLIKKLLPRAAIDFARRQINRRQIDQIDHVSEPTYASWDEAVANSAKYSDADLTLFKIKRGEDRIVDGSLLAESPLKYITIEDGCTITDFGGSIGDVGLEVLAVYPQVNYVVVENETMVEMMRGRNAVQFTTSIPDECDIFYTSGTLQYVSDPMGAFEAGVKSARRAVVLARNSFCKNEIFRVQKSPLFDNGRGPLPNGFTNRVISYPHRTINEDAVRAIAEKHGFKCQEGQEASSGVLRHNDEVYGVDLVFTR
jgi:putative methyltransferase (TIGR04325 family)